MSDEEFHAFLITCREELATLQARFKQRIQGGGPWFYDLADNSLRIGSQLFSITPIGTHSAERQTWLWAWANEDFPSGAREVSKRLQALHALTGFGVFVIPGIDATDSDAHDFVALAVHNLGAIGFFRDPGDETTPALFLAVHEP